MRPSESSQGFTPPDQAQLPPTMPLPEPREMEEASVLLVRRAKVAARAVMDFMVGGVWWLWDVSVWFRWLDGEVAVGMDVAIEIDAVKMMMVWIDDG